MLCWWEAGVRGGEVNARGARAVGFKQGPIRMEIVTMNMGGIAFLSKNIFLLSKYIPS